MAYVWLILFILVSGTGVLLTVAGMPGTWVIVVAGALFAYFGAGLPFTFGWAVVVALVLLALLGEGVEMGAGALGAKRAGASPKTALFTLGGSFIGGILGIIIGAPLPVIGSLVGAVLFSSLGALAGAVFSEVREGKQQGQAWEVGKAAFWGRLLGTLGKMICAMIMFATSAIALFV